MANCGAFLKFRQFLRFYYFNRRKFMKWETPAYCDLRLGFEVTAYVYVR
ncbi:pyrroloquinoline quinone precursor peptide PqqA [Terasakiella sp.]